MESTPTSAPWYRSMAVLTIVTILLPPVGLVMLWLRRDTTTWQKSFASLAILAMSASYLYFAYNSGFFQPSAANMEAHYDELERQRAEQRSSASGLSTGPSSGDPNSSDSSSTSP